MIACEALETKPSSQQGWLEWGSLNEAGEWIGLYGLKDSLNAEESMYYLDAAGICEAVGQSGLPAIQEKLTPALADPITSVGLPQTSTEVAPPPSDPIPWPLLPVALIAVGVMAWKRGRKMMPVREPVSAEEGDQKYPDRFTGGL